MEILLFLLFPVFFGFFVGGVTITEFTKEEQKIVSSICSEELGQCKLIVHGNMYDVTDYTVVNWFLNTPEPKIYTIIRGYNSYGIPTSTRIVLPTGYKYKL